MNKKIKNVVLWVPGISDSRGGIQTYLFMLIKAFDELLGHKGVHVFSKNDTELIDNTNFSSTINWYFIKKNRFNHSLKYGIFSLINTLKISPDLVICGHLNFAKAFYPLIFFSNAKKWLLCYGIECWFPNDKYKLRVLKSVDTCISISNYTCDRLIRNRNINAAKSQILPVSFDEKRFIISQEKGYIVREKYGISREEKIILTVARLSSNEKYKGYDVIMRLMPRLLNYESSLRYIIVGIGDDLHRIKEIIKELRLERNIILAGFVPDDELVSYYNACDVFCMPSTGEGFGIVFLEAMSCGKVVIGGDQDGSRDALCDGLLGYLVNPYDLEQVFDVLLMVLRRQTNHKNACDPQKLREIVIQRYGFKAFVNRLKEILSDHELEID